MNRFHHGGEWPEAEYDFSVNINPYGLPEPAREILHHQAEIYENYPDTTCRELRRHLADAYGLSADQVVCGNGASDLIYRIALALQWKQVMIVQPAFSEYERAFRMAGSRIRMFLTGMKNGWQIGADDLEKLESRLRQFRSPVSDDGETGIDGLILANPANPSGKLIEPEVLQEIVGMTRRLGMTLLMDECFLKFSPDAEERTLVRWFEKEEDGKASDEGKEPACAGNPAGSLIALNALTKTHAMAGLRLGYACFSDPDVAAQVSRQGAPWNVSGPAQAAGLAALRDASYLPRTRTPIAEQRQHLARALRQHNLTVIPSDANYILFRARADLGDALRKKRIAIRDCSDYPGLADSAPPGERWFRIAVRTETENDILIRAMQDVLQPG